MTGTLLRHDLVAIVALGVIMDSTGDEKL